MLPLSILPRFTLISSSGDISRAGVKMKLFPGWEATGRRTNSERWGEDVFYLCVPGTTKWNYYKLTSECRGCHEPFLAQAKRIDGHYEYTNYCTRECHTQYMEVSEETKQKHSYNGRHRSPETVQRVLEANRQPRSAATHARMRESQKGRQHTEETKALMSAAATGVPKSPEAAIKSALARRQPDRIGVAVNRVINRYRNNARTHDRIYDLTVEEVRALVLQPCHYCTAPPSAQIKLQHTYNQYSPDEEPILVNGIDRIDSSLDYVSANVVTCCIDCNIAKQNRSTAEFIAWVLQAEKFIDNRPEDLIYYGDIAVNLQPALHNVYKRYCEHNRYTGNKIIIPNTIDLHTVARLIRTQCYYCGGGLSNKETLRRKNRATGEQVSRILEYNGLDRVDSRGIYELSNVVPCCVHCNKAKLLMTQEEFYAWVHRAAEHIRATPELFSLAEANFIDLAMGMA
jgi:hypothetical protein